MLSSKHSKTLRLFPILSGKIPGEKVSDSAGEELQAAREGFKVYVQAEKKTRSGHFKETIYTKCSCLLQGGCCHHVVFLCLKMT